MKDGSIRSCLFRVSLFLFLCLLLSGSPRLIGHDEGCARTEAERALRSIPVCFTAEPARLAEHASPRQGRSLLICNEVPAAAVLHESSAHVLCDANGNVLGHRSYMHEVYQVFSLGDGFV